MACGQGLQHADAEDLAQQVFLSVSKAIAAWEPDANQPPFRVWLARITRNAIVNKLTRQKPDAPGGSTSVLNLLHELPERKDETAQQLIAQSRREAMRWAADEIRSEFTEVTWAMFWLTAAEGVAEESRMLADYDGANLLFVKPGSNYRMKFTVNNLASDNEVPLSTGECEFAVEAPEKHIP